MKVLRCISVVGLVALAFAQEVPKASLSLPTKAKPGAVIHGVATITFAEGWHGYQNPPLDKYQNPVTLTLATKGWKLQKVSYPKGVIMEMAGSQAAVYEGTVKVPFELVAPKKAGKATLVFDVSYQQCNDSTCLPPSSLQVRATITVAK